MFGVLIVVFPLKPTSPHPMSSTKRSRMFGKVEVMEQEGEKEERRSRAKSSSISRSACLAFFHPRVKFSCGQCTPCLCGHIHLTRPDRPVFLTNKLSTCTIAHAHYCLDPTRLSIISQSWESLKIASHPESVCPQLPFPPAHAHCKYSQQICNPFKIH